MQIEVVVDETCKAPKITLVTPKMTSEVSDILQKLQAEDAPRVLLGFRGDRAEILNEDDLYRVYAAGGKVYAVTAGGEYMLRLRLYELEQRLDRRHFVRISNSEIVHLGKVKSFDLSFVGTICIRLSDGTTSYVSRRYVPKIKQALGLGGVK